MGAAKRQCHHSTKWRSLSTAPTFTATCKALGFDIDYRRLLGEFKSRGTVLRAFYCTTIIEEQECSSIRPLTDWLRYNGYTVVTKLTKGFIDASGRRAVKATWISSWRSTPWSLPSISTRWSCARARAISAP
ncbi:NYN domain-containing protein [Bradyrhizobium sp. LMG 9283]|uniref:NYN domain-containing protein n=1 Tax=Bradyrhizobium sp. LMG 9283 TaxID=592064 RepID=UPI00388E6F65